MKRLLFNKYKTCCRYKEAEEDCTKAISLDNTYSKAFARRATARVALGKLQEAKQGVKQQQLLFLFFSHLIKLINMAHTDSILLGNLCFSSCFRF